MGSVNKYASLIFLQRPNALLRMVQGIHDVILLWGDTIMNKEMDWYVAGFSAGLPDRGVGDGTVMVQEKVYEKSLRIENRGSLMMPV